MNITSTQKKDTNVVEMEIAVSAEELGKAADKVYRRQAKKINVPGFRKGKAPRTVIEKMYGDGIFLEDAVNDLYPDAYADAVRTADIEPVDGPKIEVLNLDKDSGFTFRATITVKPEIELGQYKGIAVSKNIYKVEEDEIDAEVQRLRERGARVVSVEDRPAKLGDTVTIDFKGFTDGVPFAGGQSEGHKLELGSKSFIEGFEDQIVGRSIGDEFDVNVTFPEQYHSEDLQGKPAMFEVKLNEISEKQLPDIDDEFAKDVSEFDTLEELRGDICRQLGETKERKAVDEMETEIVGIITAEVKGDIPPVMYENKIGDMVQEFAGRLQSSGMALETYLQYSGMDKNAFRETFREPAERHVKMRLALETIAVKESLEADDDGVDAEYKSLSERYRVPVEQVKSAIDERDVRWDIACNKAIDFVKEHAVITEVEVKPEQDSKVEAPQETKETVEEKPAPKKRASRKTKPKADKPEESSAE